MTQPQWPNPGVHARLALELLLSGASLTSLEFQAATGSWKLAARIDELRHRYGWPVDTEQVPNPSRPRSRPIARYSLPPETISTYGSRR